MASHIGPWRSSAQGHLNPDSNSDSKTDYTRWRLVNEEGRQTWRYLESDEENEAWPQTIADKYNLGLPTVSH
jgi:lanosterol synthase